MKLHRLLLTAAFLGGSVIGASAQTATPNADSNISPATHCKDATTGKVMLKSEMTGRTTTGAGAQRAAGSPSGTAKGNTVGTAQMGGANSAQSGAAMKLPNCPA